MTIIDRTCAAPEGLCFPAAKIPVYFDAIGHTGGVYGLLHEPTSRLYIGSCAGTGIDQFPVWHPRNRSLYNRLREQLGLTPSGGRGAYVIKILGMEHYKDRAKYKAVQAETRLAVFWAGNDAEENKQVEADYIRLLEPELNTSHFPKGKRSEPIEAVEARRRIHWQSLQDRADEHLRLEDEN